jgi:prevent-host-death family protein
MEMGVYEAKTHFADLIERASRGERITITKRGKPVAELRPVGGRDNTALEVAMAKLEALRRNRPKGRKPITVAEIIAAKNEGRR